MRLKSLLAVTAYFWLLPASTMDGFAQQNIRPKIGQVLSGGAAKSMDIPA